MQNIKYSIVLPIYNMEKYLERCVNSILAQTSTSTFEVLLVDDGSRDGSPEMCDKYAASDSRFRVIHKPNGGVSTARNTGIDNAAGEYIIFFDPDDAWLPTLLETVDKLIEGSPDIALFSAFRVSENGAATPYDLPILPNGESGEQYLHVLLSSGRLPLPFSWAYAYRRKFIIENRLFFNETMRIAEDFLFNFSAIPAAKSITGTSEPLYNYFERDSSVTAHFTADKIKTNLLSRLSVFRKYPCAAVANFYFWSFLEAREIISNKNAEIIKILKQNRDILSYADQATLKLANKFVSLFGFVAGCRIFWLLADAKNSIKKGTRS